MPSSLKKACSLLFFLVLAGCDNPGNTTGNAEAGYTRLHQPAADEAMQTHIFELDNGLRVYLSENPEEPRFYSEIAVRAGSKHDPADATGLAHYLEHLLFKGTTELGTLNYQAESRYLEEIEQLYEAHFNATDEQRRADLYAEINRLSRLAAEYAVPNELDKLYGAMGASSLNAHTWHEETVYKVSLPANRLRHWAEVESERFREPVFRLFHTELEVVYEEKNRSLDNPGRISSYALNEQLYRNHPYGQQPTIGLAEHLRNPSLSYIRDYFETWYVPNNMAILISGDIDIRSTIELIAGQFSEWQPRPLPGVGPWPEPQIEEVRRETVHYPGEEEVRLAFRTVDNGHPDREALMLLDMILDNRTAGLINLNLNQRQRVQRAGSSPQFHNDYGSQQLWGVPRENQSLEEVEELLLDQIRQIRQGEFEDWILPAIVNDFERMRKQSLESNTGRVTGMREAFLTHSDWESHISELDRLRQVTRQDIIDVANRYFNDDQYVAVYRRSGEPDVPEVEKPPIDPVPLNTERQSEFAARVLNLPYPPVEPRFLEEGEDYRIEEYMPGVTLHHVDNPINDLFQFSIRIDKGSSADNRLGLAASLLEKAGTPDYSAGELQKQWYRLGSDFRISVGENQTRLSISGLDENFGESLALMNRLVRQPVVQPGVLADLKDSVIKSREDQRENPGAIARALYLYNRYGEESPMLERMDRRQLEAAESEALLALISALPDHEQTLSYTGSLSMSQLRETLRRNHPLPDQLQPVPQPRLRQARNVEDNELYLIDRPTAQAQVRIEFPDGRYDESLSVPASIYNNYFGGGMSSVVFQELREARALAYSAGAHYAPGSYPQSQNLVLGAIGTQNDKAVEATTTFLELFDDMPRSPERFDDARGSLINRYRSDTIGFRGIASAVQGWRQLGLEGDPRRDRFERLQDMTLEDLTEFHEEHVRERPKLISIMGDLERMDREALQALGEIRELDVGTIFTD